MMNKKATKKSKLPLILHISAWIVLIILPHILFTRYSGNQRFVPWDFYFTAAAFGLLFYINYLWLVPRFYLKDKKALFFILAAVAIVCFYFVTSFTNDISHNPERDRVIADRINEGISERSSRRRVDRGPSVAMQIYGYTMLSFIITGFSVGLRVIEKHSATEKRQKELEKEKLNSELAFLKNQVSPHFFFNTLNNIYSLIGVDTDNAQEAVLKLSKMMRYLLYESENNESKLSDEIVFMNNYIDLMRLRLSPKVNLEIDLPEDTENTTIPPLLFIPFIENAFKHGISYREKSFIRISLTKEEQKIQFSCVNSIGGQKNEGIHKEHSGIGLENVRKRLNLLFPKRHSLTIEEKNEEFRIWLEIETNNQRHG